MNSTPIPSKFEEKVSTQALSNELVQIHVGDSAEVLRSFPSNYFAACFTSPPYFSQIDYGYIGQIGLEATPDEYLNRLEQVFTQVFRCLQDGACCWVVIGDTINNYSPIRTKTQRSKKLGGDWTFRRSLMQGYREKEPLGIPFKFIEMMRRIGFLHRAINIWDKGDGAAIPTRTDTPCLTHEYILQFVKYSAQGRVYGNFDGKSFGSVIRLQSSSDPLHPCPFPVELPSLFLRNLKSSERMRILDPFMGIGSTLLAACELGYQAIGIDANPDYVRTNW